MTSLWLLLLFFPAGVLATQQTSVDPYQLWQREQKLARVGQGEYYELDQSIKKLSFQIKTVNDQATVLNYRLKKLAKAIASIEEGLNQKRSILAQHMRLMHRKQKTNNQQSHAGEYSDPSAGDSVWTRWWGYVTYSARSISQKLKSYRDDRKQFADMSRRLRTEIRGLLKLRKNYQNDEQQLMTLLVKKRSQLKSQNDLLTRLETELIEKYSAQNLEKEILLFHRGKLRLPAAGSVARNYGVFEETDFGYVLADKGLTLGSAPGTKVESIFQGTISFVGPLAGYDQIVIVDHQDDYYSVYAGLRVTAVQLGQTIESRAYLGLVGDDGLYFELRHFSDAIDPSGWFGQVNRSKDLANLVKQFR